MAANTRGGSGNRGDGEMPPPPDPSMAQVLRLLMEDRQAACDTQQASITALQQIAASVGQPNACLLYTSPSPRDRG